MLRCVAGSSGAKVLEPVEARAPALRFMQQLDVLVQKILPMIKDNAKLQIMPLLVRGLLLCNINMNNVVVNRI